MLIWRDRLDSVRHLLHDIELKSEGTLALVIGLLVPQRVFPHSKVSAKLEPLWKVWDGGSDWLKHLGVVLTAIFCFSFVETSTGTLLMGSRPKLRTLIDNMTSSRGRFIDLFI